MEVIMRELKEKARKTGKPDIVFLEAGIEVTN
jgi:hypothetical protein